MPGSAVDFYGLSAGVVGELPYYVMEAPVGSVFNVGSFHVFTGGNPYTTGGFTIDVSHDGVSWVTVSTYSVHTVETTVVLDMDVSARFVRLNATETSLADDRFRIQRGTWSVAIEQIDLDA